MSKQSGPAHNVSVITNVKTTTMPDCHLCGNIELSGTIPKRLIVCCDGTTNASNQGIETHPTNIARISRAIANVGYDANDREVPQITYYQAGIGTDSTASKYTKLRQQSLGEGLNGKVCEAYNYLANNYGPGDEIFIFGFSRGAYTARVLASFVTQFGLLSPGMMDYFDEIFEAYKKRDTTKEFFSQTAWCTENATPGELGLPMGIPSEPSITRWNAIKKYTHLHVKVRAVGVFDTVGSVGLSGVVPQPGQDLGWHSSSLNPKIEYAFHCLAIDETRGNFAPTLFYKDEKCAEAGVVLRQCWFPGYHSDIGGHSEAKYEVNSIDLLTFAWMVDQLTEFNLLQFSLSQLYWPVLKRIHAGKKHELNTPEPNSVVAASERMIRWSDGRLIDPNTAWPNYITSLTATGRLWYYRVPGMWKRPGAGTAVPLSELCETIHPTVWDRINASQSQDVKYWPDGFDKKEWKYVEASKSDNGVAKWVRTIPGQAKSIEIPEYQLPTIKRRNFDGKNLWSGGLQKYLASKDYLGQKEYTKFKAELDPVVQRLAKQLEMI